MTLSLGSDASLFAIGQAISGRLREILPEATVGFEADGPVVRQDNKLAVQSGPGVPTSGTADCRKGLPWRPLSPGSAPRQMRVRPL